MPRAKAFKEYITLIEIYDNFQLRATSAISITN